MPFLALEILKFVAGVGKFEVWPRRAAILCRLLITSLDVASSLRYEARAGTLGQRRNCPNVVNN